MTQDEQPKNNEEIMDILSRLHFELDRSHEDFHFEYILEAKDEIIKLMKRGE